MNKLFVFLAILIVSLLQDISFFDSETVGDLTSRLGADCQQVSRVIGYDLNLIFRNVLQVSILIPILVRLCLYLSCSINLIFYYTLLGDRCHDLLANLVLASWFMYIADMLYSGSSYASLWPVRYIFSSQDCIA